MNLAETISKTPSKKGFSLLSEKPWATKKQVLRHLEKGGFPGIFSIHENKLFHEALGDWIRLTIERDLMQFSKIKIDAEIALKVFSQLAVLEEPNNANIAKAVRCSARTSQRILDLLQILFAVHKLNPHSLGTGKPLYFYCDVALANYFGANFKRKLWTWALHEQLSQRSYIGDRDTHISYYRNTKGSFIHLVLEKQNQICPMKIIDTEKWDKRDYEILKAFGEKAAKEKKKASLTAIGSTSMQLKETNIKIYPYEALA